jgi:hypothetical protein
MEPSGHCHTGQTLFVQNFVRILKALAALGALPNRFINLERRAAAATRGISQSGFTDGITDANVHVSAPIDSS